MFPDFIWIQTTQSGYLHSIDHSKPLPHYLQSSVKEVSDIKKYPFKAKNEAKTNNYHH